MMSRSCGKERRLTKRKPKSCSCRPCGLDSLPVEMALSCLARVSRSDHPSLSLVSKSLRSLTLSTELYDVRSQMGLTEKCIFLCLSIPSDPFVRWFALCPKPLNRFRPLVPIRPHLYQPSEVSSVVALGCGIYIMGGGLNGKRSSRVFYLDCRTHTWTNLPSMGVARESAAAGVVDGKIYVFGGCEDWDSPRWGEVFDPKKQTWDALPMPPGQYSLRFHLIYESAVIEDKVSAVNASARGLFYVPSEGKWKEGNRDTLGVKKGWYVIDNVIYCCEFGGKILWCEASELEWRQPEAMEWREVKGLEALEGTLRASKIVKYGGGMLDHWESINTHVLDHIDQQLPGYKLSNSGPNMLLFWDTLSLDKMELWCAEISLERRKETGNRVYNPRS
ncbi:F-box/kelch-repeat protein At4g39560 isoform X2 [Eutrema salsugineum]|uniref:F-box/kelch-repeat protein At4g39560 isoform X2 n=1 Tax=Eutrema salsugineum TaxID=72664 RepID=UPI000CED4FD5|nr:F-box/kelch-repeat protein At4g39560 isoform X2 [Eutrema salsugineum]